MTLEPTNREVLKRCACGWHRHLSTDDVVRKTVLTIPGLGNVTVEQLAHIDVARHLCGPHKAAILRLHALNYSI